MIRFPSTVLCLILGMAGPAWSLTQQDKVQAGRDLEKKGKPEQALAVYRELAKGPARGPWVADALLGLSRLAFQAAEPPAFGPFGARPEALAEAQSHLETLLAEYPSAPAAAEAAWRLALLAVHPESPAVPASTIRNWIEGLCEKFPDSEFHSRARALLGWIELQEGRPEEARGQAALSLALAPGGPSAALAWTSIGLAEAGQGKTAPALAALGRAQRAAPPGTPAETGALEMATLIDRFARASARGQAPYSGQFLFGPEMEGKPADLGVGPGGQVALAFPREGTVITLRHASAGEDRRLLPGVRAVAFDRFGRLWTAGPGAVSCGALTLPLSGEEEILSLAPSGPRSAWIVDGRKDRVRHLGSKALEAALPPRTKPVRVVAADDGGAYVLDERAPALLRLSPEGEVTASVPLEGLAEKPIDLERDNLGRLYLLEGRSPAVLVFDSGFQLILRWEFPVVERKPSVGRPMLLGVEAGGGLVIHDARQGRVLWVR